MTITSAAFRARFNLSDKVPEATVQDHLISGAHRVYRESGKAVAPAGAEVEWDEAVLYAALISVLPYLHLFALDGIAPVMRMAENGGTTVRFLTPADTEAVRASAEREYQTRLRVINPNAGAGVIRVGGITMVAINGT